MATYKIKATAILPVHVGGGQEQLLDPLEYVVKDDIFYRVNIEKMLETDPAFASRFLEMVDSNSRSSILSLRSLLVDAFDPQKKESFLWKAKASKAFADRYKRSLHDPANQLLVQCLPRDGALAYIPGSSIKGSIRTAILDQRAAEMGYENVARQLSREHPRQKDQFVEAVVLKAQKGFSGQIKPQTDPFKALKVGDAHIPEEMTKIVEVKNVPAEKQTFAMFFEVVMAGTDFSFELTVNNDMDNRTVEEKITRKEVLESCYNYYGLALDNECRKFYGNSKATAFVDKALSVEPDERETIIRVGRFSHIESVTYNDEALRKPKPPRDRKTGRPRGWGNTRNLVNGVVPLGIIKLEFPA